MLLEYERVREISNAQGESVLYLKRHSELFILSKRDLREDLKEVRDGTLWLGKLRSGRGDWEN